MHYDAYQHLRFERPAPGVLAMQLDRVDAHNAINDRLHHELATVWSTIAHDPETRVVLVSGRGRAFSAGAELDMVEAHTTDPDRLDLVREQVAALVYGMVRLDKPIISAIHGVAIGAGLSVALLADISIAADNARLGDGHARVGLPAGDHAALVWPLLCSMAKAKYYLLTGETMSGREAERIGLVSRSVPPDEVMPEALKLATALAAGSQTAIRLTKRSLNQWLLQAGPLFDQSLELQLQSFADDDVREGIAALRDKRAPLFPSANR